MSWVTMKVKLVVSPKVLMFCSSAKRGQFRAKPHADGFKKRDFLPMIFNERLKGAASY
jgi:hypothetical protein